MTDHNTLFAFYRALHDRLSLPHQIFASFNQGVMEAHYGSRSFRLADVPAILDGFVELDVAPELVAQAVAAMALDHFGIEHQLGDHGLTIAVCGTGALRREIAAGLSQARAEQFSSRTVMQIADSVLDELDDDGPKVNGR